MQHIYRFLLAHFWMLSIHLLGYLPLVAPLPHQVSPSISVNKWAVPLYMTKGILNVWQWLFAEILQLFYYSAIFVSVCLMKKKVDSLSICQLTLCQTYFSDCKSQLHLHPCFTLISLIQKFLLQSQICNTCVYLARHMMMMTFYILSMLKWN